MWKSNRNPQFRTELAETIFHQKYAHEGAETWEDLARTLVEDVMRTFVPQSVKDAAFEFIRDMKFIPGGRYLYYAGRPFKAFNNCLTGDTRLLTDKGWVRFDAVVDQTVNVWSPVEGDFLPAVMHAHGRQLVNRITLMNVRGRSLKKWVVHATQNHRWPLRNGGETSDLRVGNVVPANTMAMDIDPEGYVHGVVFGDGTFEYSRERDGVRVYRLRLCGRKAALAPAVAGSGMDVREYDPIDGDPFYRVHDERDLKVLPSEDASPEYIAGFLKGWLDTDGHQGDVSMLHSVNEAAIDYFIEHCVVLGLVVTGEKLVEVRPSNFGERQPLYHVNFQRGGNFQGFKVVAIEPVGVQDVFCPFEPKHNRIVIDHGIDTYQCFLLRCEEDTREDWANLSWKAESCLMTGGGIGADYSRYRGKNQLLHRTGGLSSGPLPKMQMTNEIGRRVMQGGSRRSAIYASLNWKHQDIEDFLVCKNWDDMPVAGTNGLTIGDLKQADFNYPAPLDMTNISVNYDTEWLEGNRLNAVFVKNVEQAMRTAEPGFSFNFYDQENETLRNACTEVTSEDDSDVCNLASLNMSRIGSLAEFRSVVEVATIFLICGTMVADLPYSKVYQVREKNRRLGLGLMGIHEWLIQRGYRYEVVDELHDWLRVYKGVSDKTAFDTADRMGISRPKGRRAIAPTGTIGILAGTTTGVEPMFAVAYKRRFLKNGTDWHYQYVVDGTAQLMIDEYGADPDKLESAMDLAADYERRMKFQADVQDYVDMSISSTINLPKWGTELNNPDTVEEFAKKLAHYAPRLRGFTCYPDGARGGQPLTPVPYQEAAEKRGQTFAETTWADICDITGKGGSCGV